MKGVTITCSIQEAANRLAASMAQNDELYNSVFDQIDEMTSCLTEDVDNQKKYDSIVSIEYLLVRLRIKTSFEQLKVKGCLSDVNTPASLRGMFMKRAEYLSQITLKLDAIRDDISVLQKCVYAQQSRYLH